MPALKQVFWKIWYQYISGRIGMEPVTFLNYGYWPPEGKTLELKVEDEANRPTIQLYHHVASGWDLAGKEVLEVSCGHGGGASFVRRYHRPAAYTAVDQNPRAVDFDRKIHGSLGIDFRTGDAQALDFPDEHFDALLNVEASHCYPRQELFFRSAHRVLKPGGHLLFADFRAAADCAQLERDILASGLQIKSKSDITANVLSALRRNSKNYRDLAHKFAPKILHNFMENFAAVEGTSMFNSFVNRERVYWSYQLMKPA